MMMVQIITGQCHNLECKDSKFMSHQQYIEIDKIRLLTFLSCPQAC